MQSKLDDYAINSHSEREEETQQIFHHFENFVVKLKRIFKNSEEEAITSVRGRHRASHMGVI